MTPTSARLWKFANVLDAIYWSIPPSDARARTAIQEVSEELRDYARALSDETQPAVESVEVKTP